MKELIGTTANLSLVATERGFTPAVELVFLYSEAEYGEDPARPGFTRRGRRVGHERFAGVPAVLREIAARLNSFADEADGLMERLTPCQSTDTGVSATRAMEPTDLSALLAEQGGVLVG